MIVKYRHRGVERWIEAYQLIKLGKVTEILSVPDEHGITTVEVEGFGQAMIGDYRVPEVGDDLFEGMRDAFHVAPGPWLTPDQIRTSPRLVQFSGTNVEFYMQTRDNQDDKT